LIAGDLIYLIAMEGGRNLSGLEDLTGLNKSRHIDHRR